LVRSKRGAFWVAHVLLIETVELGHVVPKRSEHVIEQPVGGVQIVITAQFGSENGPHRLRGTPKPFVAQMATDISILVCVQRSVSAAYPTYP
jgi:hypothetical protein